jgi:hypothetical protein
MGTLKTGRLPTIEQATRAYEAWLRSQIEVVDRDLQEKHRLMADQPFSHLRATFYRWAALFPAHCPALADTQQVLGVGDLHVENFGTWRDGEGRLVWGVNDLDEACPVPFANDLVRLAASALMTIKSTNLKITAKQGIAAILDGYRHQLAGPARPFVLEEAHSDLRAMALSSERDAPKFWEKLHRGTAIIPPKEVRKLLTSALPKAARADKSNTPSKPQFLERVAGAGSLGRPRYVAIIDYDGGFVAREAKALVPSAWEFIHRPDQTKILFNKILDRAIRCPDPFYRAVDRWVLRRLGPHCGRIELAQLPKGHDPQALLHAMGRECANIHLGTPRAMAAIAKDLATRKEGWLYEAATIMEAAIADDFIAYSSARNKAKR